MLVAQSTLSHISQLDCAFGAGIHEPITAYRVELCSGNDFGQFLHVGGLDVDNVEALVLDVEVPEVDPQIVTANERFAIAVYRYAVDVVGKCVGVCLPRYCSNDSIVMCESRKLQVGGVAEVRIWVPDRTTSTSNPTSGRQLVREIVFCHHLQRLFKNLPELDRLVICGKQVVRGILAATPLDLVDLLFDL
jgi:hypothetical protein